MNKPFGGDIHERKWDGQIVLGIIVTTCGFALIGAFAVGVQVFNLVRWVIS